METSERTRPFAIFMAFGTKGDVYPIAAIAGAFASDQTQYRVFLITHSAHEGLSTHLATKHVDFVAISSPPVLSANESAGALDSSFSQRKKIITMEHRRECLSVVERIFGNSPSIVGDFIVINFFALEGWNLAELFHVRCIVAAPYVVPYSAPSTFERQFREELPLLYDYLQTAPTNKVSWNDVIHWMWPLFTENWGSWRSDDLNLSPCPLTDPVTGLPTWHDRPPSPFLLYGFSKEVVECPDYWPSNIRICGFWFLPTEWQFSCKLCGEISALASLGHHNIKDEFCSAHIKLQSFLKMEAPVPIFIGLSSIGSMGFMWSPLAFLRVLQAVLELESYRFILFSAGYEPLNAAIHVVAHEAAAAAHIDQTQIVEEGVSLFGGRLFCFSGCIPYNWLFPRCAAAVHHGGSGSTAAALHAGIPQVVCPFMLDQFYWAERVFWLGVAPEPLKKEHLIPDVTDNTCIREAANMLLKAINCALSPETKAKAFEIAERISHEDGILEAVQILKEEIIS